MPYINVKLSVPSSIQQNIELKSLLGQAICLLPGKSEAHLMVGIEDNCTLFFHGENGKIAFVEVKILGKSTKSAYNDLTAEICKILGDIYKISGNNIYVKFEEIENWGYDSFMF